MNSKLGFLPVIGDVAPASPSSSPPAPVLVPVSATSGMRLVLVADATGSLAVQPAADPTAAGGTILAELTSQPSTGIAAWWLAPRSGLLTVNGLVPLGLSAVVPGDLLAFGDHWWLTVSQWTAQTGPAPADMAEKPCPVCGMPLNIAPVVQCPCGRLYHLENPEATDPADVLNCFLSGPCRMCNRTPSLGPVLLPEPPAKLLGTPVGIGE